MIPLNIWLLKAGKCTMREMFSIEKAVDNIERLSVTLLLLLLLLFTHADAAAVLIGLYFKYLTGCQGNML